MSMQPGEACDLSRSPYNLKPRSVTKFMDRLASMSHFTTHDSKIKKDFTVIAHKVSYDPLNILLLYPASPDRRVGAAVDASKYAKYLESVNSSGRHSSWYLDRMSDLLESARNNKSVTAYVHNSKTNALSVYGLSLDKEGFVSAVEVATPKNLSGFSHSIWVCACDTESLLTYGPVPEVDLSCTVGMSTGSWMYKGYKEDVTRDSEPFKVPYGVFVENSLPNKLVTLTTTFTHELFREAGLKVVSELQKERRL